MPHRAWVPNWAPTLGPGSTAVPGFPGPQPGGHRELAGAHAAVICCLGKPALQPEGAAGETEDPGSPPEPVPDGVRTPLREKPSRQIGNQKS